MDSPFVLINLIKSELNLSQSSRLVPNELKESQLIKVRALLLSNDRLIQFLTFKYGYFANFNCSIEFISNLKSSNPMLYLTFNNPETINRRVALVHSTKTKHDFCSDIEHENLPEAIYRYSRRPRQSDLFGMHNHTECFIDFLITVKLDRNLINDIERDIASPFYSVALKNSVFRRKIINDDGSSFVPDVSKHKGIIALLSKYFYDNNREIPEWLDLARDSINENINYIREVNARYCNPSLETVAAMISTSPFDYRELMFYVSANPENREIALYAISVYPSLICLAEPSLQFTLLYPFHPATWLSCKYCIPEILKKIKVLHMLHFNISRKPFIEIADILLNISEFITG